MEVRALSKYDWKAIIVDPTSKMRDMIEKMYDNLSSFNCDFKLIVDNPEEREKDVDELTSYLKFL